MMNDNRINSQYQHWYSIDLVKGILVILVFVGHIIPGILRDTFPRYLIYSFHMPLFVGVSGFLFDIEKKDVCLRKMFMKYWRRLGKPWVVAVVLYWLIKIVSLEDKTSITLLGIINAFCYPYYHLWYILGYVSYMSIICILWKKTERNRLRWVLIFGVASIISVISKWNILEDIIKNEYLLMAYEYIQYDFRLYNLIFFAIGVYLRYRYEHRGEVLSKATSKAFRILVWTSIAIVIALFFYDNPNVELIMFYIMNVSMLVVILHDSVKSKMPRCIVLEFIGKYSLPIYLYHILCKICGEIFFVSGSGKYYMVCILSFLLGCVLVLFLRKIPFVNKVIFGMTNLN